MDEKPIIQWKRLGPRRHVCTITRPEEIEEQKRFAEWGRMMANVPPGGLGHFGYSFGSCPCCGRAHDSGGLGGLLGGIGGVLGF